MIYVTSDLHGYPLSRLQDMLSYVSFSEEDELYILGDVIDRNGDGGVETLRWIMCQPNVTLLMGNHEDMLLRCLFLFDPVTEESVEALTEEQLARVRHWARNGAEPTLSSLHRLLKEDRDALFDLLDFLRELPLYDILKINSRVYILVHAGLGGYSPKKDLSDYTDDELLWTRPALTDTYYKKATVILGHTYVHHYGPQYTGRMIRTPTWIDIDTGAAAGLHPMLLRLEDERPFYFDDPDFLSRYPK